MKLLGFTPVIGSGSGWIHKEDGETEDALVQLKSTDASSYRIDMLDIKKLEYHAEVSHKLPIFLVQFLQQDKIYAVIGIEYIDELPRLFNLTQGNAKGKANSVEVIDTEICKSFENVSNGSSSIKSSSKARKQFFKDKEEKYGRRK